MSFHRGILSFVLLVSVALTLIDTTEATNLIAVLSGPRDHLAGREDFKKPWKILQVVEADRTFNTMNDETISQVLLLDQNRNGNGATATITAGGPGAKYATVHFKSMRGHGIDFIAELFGQ